MAPSSHARSFPLLRKVSQPRCAEDVIQVPILGLAWWHGRGAGHGEVVAGLASETKPKIASQLLACPAIQGRRMETASSRQSFQMLQGVSHQAGHLRGAPAEQPAKCSQDGQPAPHTCLCPHTTVPVRAVTTCWGSHTA